MAEDKKPSRGERMYGKSPKISPIEEEKSESEAEKSREKASPRGEAGEEVAELAENVGAGSIPIHEVQIREMKALHTRHQQEYRDMLRRHATEATGGGGHTGAKASGESTYSEKNVGKSGTEP